MRNRSSDPCRGRLLLIALLAGLVLAGSTPAAGQGATASIIGQVTDQSGAVLPGVTVTATSPALQVPQVMSVTNDVGEYRLAPLPIGVMRSRSRSAGSSRSSVRTSGSPSASRRSSMCS